MTYLVGGVPDLRGSPRTAAGDVLTLRVRDHRGDPVAVFLVLIFPSALSLFHIKKEMHSRPTPRASQPRGQEWSRAPPRASPRA